MLAAHRGIMPSLLRTQCGLGSAQAANACLASSPYCMPPKRRMGPAAASADQHAFLSMHSRLGRHWTRLPSLNIGVAECRPPTRRCGRLQMPQTDAILHDLRHPARRGRGLGCGHGLARWPGLKCCANRSSIALSAESAAKLGLV